MRFNKNSLTVKAGKNVELIFNNDDTLPLMHNLLLVKPGTRIEIVNEAIAMGANGMANNYVPDNANVLASTPLVQIGNSYKLYFKAPVKSGNYEYVCTYPGHGLTMWGTLIVE
jgi:azurin